ncbi:hypothetical protein IDH44_07005 [Paenibacillus sp. IB182496]|uniref:Membrane protein YkvI n=1 Tax=Paenibacillus sabuli TaxID=2772509 RepID=A0A927BQK7_9BACL|nr:hypothetical protein [Paenibacillus sabuli]MBD2844932.1 hypothetical protein [Paenibacillus sabuli]
MRKTLSILQIAATYIGTVIGAGFASGLSILQFFTSFGAYGTVGIAISTLLFMWIGMKMMLLAHRIRAFSYQQFNTYLFGSFFGRLANMISFGILFGVTAVMLSGAGSIAQQQLGLSYQLGILCSLVLIYLTMKRELGGVLAINSFVMPLMLCFTAIVAYYFGDPEALFALSVWQREQAAGLSWLLHALAYAALNFVTLQAVLVPLGSEAKSESVIKWGALWGGIGLGFMLLVSHAAMQQLMPDILRYPIPMGEVIRHLAGWLHLLFVLVIYGEIFTTLIGNVFGMTRQLQSVTKLPREPIVLGLLGLAYVLGQVGFEPLLASLYTVFGYIGIWLVALLAIKRLPRPRE